jgi:DNA-binding phage protein
LRTWAQLKHGQLKKSPDVAIAYLKASLEENSDQPDLILKAIKSVSEAYGLSLDEVAEKSGKSSSTIHRALSINGNPGLDTLLALPPSVALSATR